MTFTDAELEIQRLAGELWLILEDGPRTQRESALRLIESILGPEKRQQIEKKLGI